MKILQGFLLLLAAACFIASAFSDKFKFYWIGVAALVGERFVEQLG